MVPGGSLLDYNMVRHWQSYLSSFVEDVQSLDFVRELKGDIPCLPRYVWQFRVTLANGPVDNA